MPRELTVPLCPAPSRPALTSVHINPSPSLLAARRSGTRPGEARVQQRHRPYCTDVRGGCCNGPGTDTLPRQGLAAVGCCEVGPHCAVGQALERIFGDSRPCLRPWIALCFRFNMRTGACGALHYLPALAGLRPSPGLMCCRLPRAMARMGTRVKRTTRAKRTTRGRRTTRSR